jgi:exoribonuclease R
MSEITSGLRCGIYHQGKLRVNRYNPFEAYVGSESIGDEIIIRGRSNMNRAFDGDIVSVELLPQDQWHETKSFIADDDGMHFNLRCISFSLFDIIFLNRWMFLLFQKMVMMRSGWLQIVLMMLHEIPISHNQLLDHQLLLSPADQLDVLLVSSSGIGIREF